MKNIAFVGLGVMGGPIAGHLAKGGYSVKVFNRTTSRAIDWLKKYPGEIGSTPADVARDAEFIFCCVGGDEDLREVVTGEYGIVNEMSSGSILVDHSTVSANISKELASICAKSGSGFLDAPLSGGQKGAEDGELSIMCGGQLMHFEKAKPVISSYAKKLVHMGKVGNGQLTKMVNQICIAGLLQGLAEGLAFASNADLNVLQALEAIGSGAAGSWQMHNRGCTMIDDSFEFGFAVDWMRKDLAICLQEAETNGSELAVTSLVDRFYSEIQNMGGNRWDTSSLVRRLPRKHG
ncbi:MAG: NAD(P)-dependent oxidoreductase [Cellvibrionales bacterium TMED148]|nr:oxidoreductase [Porticoccaceae bacterium]RPG91174.1 MAG: NAD(P)-dependent oxidoreductase [Cellvibrionales bacterium TMED148]